MWQQQAHVRKLVMHLTCTGSIVPAAMCSHVQLPLRIYIAPEYNQKKPSNFLASPSSALQTLNALHPHRCRRLAIPARPGADLQHRAADGNGRGRARRRLGRGSGALPQDAAAGQRRRPGPRLCRHRPPGVLLTIAAPHCSDIMWQDERNTLTVLLHIKFRS